MASTYSTNLALELIGTGEQSGTWGTTTNTNLGTLLEQAISGYVTQAITDGSGANTTITIPNGTTGVARNMFIEMTGALTFATTSLIVPANKKMYFIFNNTSGGFAVTVKVSGQTGILVPNGKKVILTCNGTDIVEAHTAIVGNATMGGTLASGTITVSSDMVIATGSITSASGAIDFGNENLSTTGKLTAGAGVTAAGNVGSSFGSTFTSDGASSVVIGTRFAGTMTAVTGDTTYLDHVNLNRSVVTQNNSETIGRIATLTINEPDITKGTDTVTLAATVYVGAAPDEGVSNYAIYVAGGACSFGGTLSTRNSIDITRTVAGDAVFNAIATGGNGYAALVDMQVKTGGGAAQRWQIGAQPVATDGSFELRNVTGGAIPFKVSSTSSTITMSAYGAGTATFSAAGVISSVSDETWKIKDGIPTDPDAMLQKLAPGYWFYNEEKRDTFGTDRQLGFYAQNVNAAIGPEAAPEPEEGKPWGYYDRSVLAVAVMSLQSALTNIQTLSAKVAALEAR
jgi:hypothetical protein